MIALLNNQGLPTQLAAQERDALLLIENTYDDIDFEYLSDFYKTIMDHELFDRYKELGIRVFELAEDVSAEEIESLAQEAADILVALSKDLGLASSDSEQDEGDELLEMYATEGLDPVQQRVLARSLELYYVKQKPSKENS